MPAAALLAALVAALITASLVAAPSAGANHYDSLLPPQGSAACPKQNDPTAFLREQKRAMRCLHRYARNRASKPPVSAHQQLQDAAQAKAADIMRCQQFRHMACGRDWQYWPRYFGYTKIDSDTCRYALAENISWASGRLASARSIMSAWLHSDQHRDTILRDRWRDIGVGLKRGTFKGNPNSQVWVVILGRQWPPGSPRCVA